MDGVLDTFHFEFLKSIEKRSPKLLNNRVWVSDFFYIARAKFEIFNAMLSKFPA